MRQVTDAEIVWNLKHQLKRLGPAIRNQLASRHAKDRDMAIQVIAEQLAKGALGRFEILASGDPHTLADSIYDKAAFGTGDMVTTEDTVPIGPVPERGG